MTTNYFHTTEPRTNEFNGFSYAHVIGTLFFDDHDERTLHRAWEQAFALMRQVDSRKVVVFRKPLARGPWDRASLMGINDHDASSAIALGADVDETLRENIPC